MPVEEINATEAANEATGVLTPWIALRTSLRFWWLLVLLIALGSLGGWLFSLSHPPLYEAVTNFSVWINDVQTGNMTQFEKDVAINKFGDLLLSSAVVDQVVAQAGSFVLVGLLIEGFRVDTFAFPYYWVSLGMVTAA